MIDLDKELSHEEIIEFIGQMIRNYNSLVLIEFKKMQAGNAKITLGKLSRFDKKVTFKLMTQKTNKSINKKDFNQ